MDSDSAENEPVVLELVRDYTVLVVRGLRQIDAVTRCTPDGITDHRRFLCIHAAQKTGQHQNKT